MRRVALATAAAVVLGLSVEAAHAQPVFVPCEVGAECAGVEVPLERENAASTTLSLTVTRVRGTTPGATPLVVLTGGPGQAGLGSLPGGVAAMQELSRTTGGRHVLSLDQRGTGVSALRCAALDAASGDESAPTSLAAAAAQCAAEVGPGRVNYTTGDTIDDLEQVRTELGLERWSVLGISYGSFVASAYARLHPERLERVVLDSPVPLEGESASSTELYTAARRVLADICADRACRGITRDLRADIRQLAERLQARPVFGISVDIRGRPQRRPFGGPQTPGALLQAFVSGDQRPAARQAFPAAVRAALAGDASLLNRIAGSGGGADERAELQSEALFLATICQDSDVPWAASDPAEIRRAELSASLAGLPASTYAPFTRADALGADVWPICVGWPEAETYRPPAGGIPASVPTMILVGTTDVRTPLESAQRIAAVSPSVRVVPVEGAGHSVLTERRECVDVAMRAFFGGAAPFDGICDLDRDGERDPAPVPPRGLAEVPSISDLPPVVDRTLSAAIMSLADVEMAIGLGVDEGTSARGRGLRGGTVRGRLDSRGLTLQLRRYVYVPGVAISGTLRNGAGRLRVRGAFAKGVVRLRSDGRIVGRLGGEPVSLAAGRVGLRLSELGPGAGRGTPGPDPGFSSGGAGSDSARP